MLISIEGMDDYTRHPRATAEKRMADLSTCSATSATRRLGALQLCIAARTAHREGQFELALRHFSCGLALLSATAEPIVDFGLADELPPSLAAECVPLAQTLFIRRAAAALKLGLRLRALADTSAALALGRSHLCAMLRSRALIQVGAYAHAASTIAPYLVASAHATISAASSVVPAKRLLARGLASALLDAAARARDASVPRSIAAIVDAPNAAAPLARELAYVHGSLAMRRFGGKGRGWVATAAIAAGTLLVVEPALFPTVGPQLTDAEEDTLPLLQAVAAALSTGGALAEQMKEYLQCMCPLDSSEVEPHTMRDSIAAPFVDAIGKSSGLSEAATRTLDRKLQRNQMGLKLRVGGELADFGSGVFPFAAIFNHSCHPHAQWRPLSSGSAIIVRAIRDLQPGEEASPAARSAASLPAAPRAPLPSL